jgi:hypothetical protein
MIRRSRARWSAASFLRDINCDHQAGVDFSTPAFFQTRKKFSMKQTFAMLVFFLALDICQPSIFAATGSSGFLPANVSLNGLTTALGSSHAFLQISFSNSSPENILLAEGQTFRGIKLLAVDFPSGCIRIDNCGQIQTIKICDTPNLTSMVASNNSGINTNATDTRAGSEGNADSATIASPGAITGSSSIQTNAGLAVAKSDTSNSSAGNISSANSNPDTGTSANSSNSHVYYWWLQDAKDIEQTRIATAQSVLAGEMAPQPLTPLTPPLTPAGLIGPDSVYMEHGPGVLISDQGTVLGIATRTVN